MIRAANVRCYSMKNSCERNNSVKYNIMHFIEKSIHFVELFNIIHNFVV